MNTNNPKTIDDKVYDKLAVFLASAPLINGANMRVSANLNLVPQRTDEEGNIELNSSHGNSVLFSDLLAQGDQDVLIAFGKIEAALQELINKKGW